MPYLTAFKPKFFTRWRVKRALARWTNSFAFLHRQYGLNDPANLESLTLGLELLQHLPTQPLTLQRRRQTVVTVTLPSAGALLSALSYARSLVALRQSIPSNFSIHKSASTYRLDDYLVTEDGRSLTAELVESSFVGRLKQLEDVLREVETEDSSAFAYYQRKFHSLFLDIYQLLQALYTCRVTG